ncbi:MAG TPA: tRNA guanosine(15) transglycosylase TgtA [Thermoplasmata archaeon]|nr:tRNA guanosine(15) transglycosylase TgtA [Thermoplasmata archaeon]
MVDFELLERDGLARLGRFTTPHGRVETPTLLPVVHPDPSRQPIPARDLREKFGLGAVITSSYITWRTPTLRETAEASGIHGLLQFDGPVMTDSGAFQQHAYGQVEVGPEEILNFQRRIGSDIATVLDVFVEPESSREVAEAGVRTTLERARAARELTHGLLAVPVQGGLFPDLRRTAAEEASSLGDVLAVGGVVPLLEQYRFAALANLLVGARPGLDPGRVVHLFGTGHPASFAFAALFGVDLFDSSSYHKFARRGGLLFPDGTVAIDSLREPICNCRLCARLPLTEAAHLPAPERERAIAEHNLLVCATEIGRVRQAIRDGTLWELAERRATAHPGLLAGLRAAVRGARVFLPTEPDARRSFRVVGATSGLRPAVIRFLARLSQWKAGKGEFRPLGWRPLVPSTLRTLPTRTRDGTMIWYEVPSPFGGVPLELTELYPVGCAVAMEEFDESEPLRGPPDLTGLDVAAEGDWLEEWTRRHRAGVFEWLYGAEPAARLGSMPFSTERSRKTGRVRSLDAGDGRAFIIDPSGLPRPTFRGGELLRTVLPFPQARIIVHPDAVGFVREGRSLFSKFVEGGDSSLVPGGSALLVDRDDRLLAVGRLLLAPSEMGHLERGVAVRVTAHRRSPEPSEDLERELAEGPAGVRGRDAPLDR